MSDSLQYDELARALGLIGAGQAGAEFHGLVCGAYCVLDEQQVSWQGLIQAPDPARALNQNEDAEAVLGQCTEQALASLRNVEAGFNPLLPDDAIPLSERVLALVEWCEGFLLGLASRPGLDLSECSEELQEIVKDFTEFTQAGLSSEGDQELEENAYTELVEYIRVGVQLIYIEFKTHGVEAERPTLH